MPTKDMPSLPYIVNLGRQAWAMQHALQKFSRFQKEKLFFVLGYLNFENIQPI